MTEETPKEPSPRDILLRNIKGGFVEARRITKEDTYKNSKEIMDVAWKAGEELINSISVKFFNFPPEKKYPVFSPQQLALSSLHTELVKTFQNAFRLAEEGYYRSAFGELRDILETVMKIKLFYEDETHLIEWGRHPNKMYTTKEIRKSDLFKNSGLNQEIEGFSNGLSMNRHCSRMTLDSLGPLMTNACYYRKPIFDKWCKHMIILKDLGIKIINF